MVKHNLAVDRVALHGKERHVKHIEHAPVLRHGVRMREAGKKRRNHIFFRFCAALPYRLTAHPQTDYKRTGFYRLLECAERIGMAGDLLQFLVGSGTMRVARRTGAQYLVFVIVFQPKTADRKLRLNMQQRRGDKQRAGQRSFGYAGKFPPAYIPPLGSSSLSSAPYTDLIQNLYVPV